MGRWLGGIVTKADVWTMVMRVIFASFRPSAPYMKPANCMTMQYITHTR